MKAAIDIGTNTLRLLIGEVKGDGVKVGRQFVEETRLGTGIEGKRLLVEAMERTLAALVGFQEICRSFGVTDVGVVATSAVRDAANRADFVRMVDQATGWQVAVLSGTEEANLAYRGAISALPVKSGTPVVIDIGGGSTEVIFSRSGQVCADSANVGAVRLTENMLTDDLLKKELEPAIRGVNDLSGSVSLIGVGGTITTAAAVFYSVESYTREAVHGRMILLSEIKNLRSQLQGITLEERKQLVGMTPGRVDIIIPGLTILITALDLLGVNRIWVSDAGILDGVLLNLSC